jgi:hypothetical protein
VDASSSTPAEKGWFRRGRGHTLAAVIVATMICGATTAGAAKLITGADVKDGSLTGKDIKKGSVPKADLNSDVQKALTIRVTDGLPTQGFSAKGTLVKNSPDGVKFGTYADGGTEHGSLCTNSMNGQPFSDVKHLAFEARYTADTNTGGVGVPYLRIFLNNNADDAIFSPNTQLPDPDVQQGPFHTWVATAGSWRYDDDIGNNPDSPFSTIKQAHATEKISKICISVGASAGVNLSSLLRTWEVNTKDYAFGQ